MSNYIPHYSKKQQILRRKEQDLRRVIQSNENREKIFKIAEEVRESRIRALKAKLANPPHGWSMSERDRAIAKIQILENASLEIILAEFGYDLSSKPKG